MCSPLDPLKTFGASSLFHCPAAGLRLGLVAREKVVPVCRRFDVSDPPNGNLFAPFDLLRSVPRRVLNPAPGEVDAPESSRTVTAFPKKM